MLEQTATVNIFNAPVHYIASTDSTMRIARSYAKKGYPHGTFVYAGMQTAGRGRTAGRVWYTEAGKNMAGTLLLKQADVAAGFTLRMGLAVYNTVATFLPVGVKPVIKWPNDILVQEKKISGILCESFDSYILTGIGINVLQTDFPAAIAETATSLALACGTAEGEHHCPSVADVADCFLEQAHAVLANDQWHKAVSARLWKTHCTVQFTEGSAQAPVQSGVIEGICADGALQIRCGNKIKAVYSGELLFKKEC